MSKEYVCDSCREIMKNPHDVKMKEFYIGYTLEMDGALPYCTNQKVKIHLCDDCFRSLKEIAKKAVTNE